MTVLHLQRQRTLQQWKPPQLKLSNTFSFYNSPFSEELNVIIALFIFFERGNNSLIDYELKESIFDDDNDLFLTERKKLFI
jgi:hypothetical protein